VSTLNRRQPKRVNVASDTVCVSPSLLSLCLPSIQLCKELMDGRTRSVIKIYSPAGNGTAPSLPYREKHMFRRKLIQLGLMVFLLLGITAGSAGHLSGRDVQAVGQPAQGTLEISFLFNNAQGVVPSYQLAIWLEDLQGKYVKTLFVSNWLAGAGIGLDVVCPDWVRQANWDKVEEEEFDATTRPTPPIGSNTLKFNCPERKIAAGSYRFSVQAHIVENYNILYRGTILIGKDSSEGVGEAFFSPKRHPMASDILNGVRARYLAEPEAGPPSKGEKP